MIVEFARWLIGLMSTFIVVLDKRWELIIVVLFPLKDTCKVVLVLWMK